MSGVFYAPDYSPRPIRHVFMDWDGTTSLTRGGWSEVMLELYAELLPLLPGETPESLRIYSRAELMKLNGRPSIHQMYRLAELVSERGGRALSADEYQREYQSRIGAVVEGRLARIRCGEVPADSILVPGARALFSALRELGVPVTLASGTPYPELIDEVRLLGLEADFAGIFGPQGIEDRDFSKREILHRVIRDYQIDGAAVLAFGDGPVELIETRAVGGLSVAIAVDESAPARLDPWKRETLFAAGAHAAVANFSGLPEILEAFFSR